MTSFRNRRRNFSLFLMLGAGLFALCACEAILPQDPADHFADGKMPASAARFANQIWDLPRANSVAARLEKDGKNPYLLRVGVIDNGLDLAHPDLVGQIDYRMKGNRISGVGADVFGQDDFASPQMLRYEFFAFGSQKIEGDRIVGAPKDPLALLAKYDQDFLKTLVPMLCAEKALEGTFFSRVDASNFSILGAQIIANTPFDEKAYAKKEAEKQLLTLAWKPKDAEPETLRLAYEKLYPFVYARIVLDDTGLPRPDPYYPESVDQFDPRTLLSSLAGAREFRAIVAKAYEDFARTSGYGASFENFLVFMAPRYHKLSESREARVPGAIKKLAAALYFKRMGYASADPIRLLENTLKAAALRRKVDAAKEWTAGPIQFSIEDMRAAARENLEVMRSVTAEILRTPDRFEVSEVESAETFQKNARVWGDLYEEFLSQRGWDPATGDFAKVLSSDLASSYRRYLVKTAHPYLDPQSIDESHGTHVSGIIAKQNPNLRIFPIRVLTATSRPSPVSDPRILENFKTGFLAWMREPLVARALEGYLSDAFDSKGEELLKEAGDAFDRQMRTDFGKNSLDYRFVSQVREAIRVAGREKLKLVNISLGTGFKSSVIDYKTVGRDKKIAAAFGFLKYEYFKWIIGKAVREDAPGTLFLIATGNDGEWKDGQSRSGLPADLSSPFLAEYENTAAGQVAPNNQVTNILGVGSITQKDWLSSYSNLLISKTPMIFAHGEAVLSPVRSLSSEAIKPYWDEEISIYKSMSKLATLASGTKEKGVFVAKDRRVDSVLAARYGLDAKASNYEQAMGAVRRRIRDEMSIFSAAEGGMSLDLFFRYPTIRKRMSGTSMATPVLAGLLANEVQKKIAADKIPAAEIYQHPDFSPEKLIELAFAKSTSMNNSKVIDLRKWTGELEWEKSPAEVALEARIRRAKDGDRAPKSVSKPKKSASGKKVRYEVL